MLTFAEADLARVMDPGALHRGRLLQSEGKVLEADANAAGTVIVGRVRGGDPRPYQQMISLKPPNPHSLQIFGTCSCAVKINCKHVAAVLLQAARQLAVAQPEAPADTTTASLPVAQRARTELSPQVRLWLGDLDEAARGEAASNDYPPEIRQRLIYVLDTARAREGLPARLKPMVTNVGKGGALGPSAKSYSPSNIFNYQPAKHLRPVDHEILAELELLIRRAGTGGSGELPLRADPQIVALFRKVLATGRCRLDSVAGAVVSEGEIIAADFRWVRMAGGGGRQRLAIQPRAGADGQVPRIDAVLPLSPPFYVNAQSGLAGPLDLGVPPRIAARLAEAPEVSASDAAQVVALLDRHLTTAGIKDRVPLPQPPQKAEMRHVRPVPRLELHLGEVSLRQHFVWMREISAIAACSSCRWRGSRSTMRARRSPSTNGARCWNGWRTVCWCSRRATEHSSWMRWRRWARPGCCR